MTTQHLTLPLGLLALLSLGLASPPSATQAPAAPAGVTVVPCPGQKKLPEGEYEFCVDVADDAYYGDCGSANSFVSAAEREALLAEEIESLYRCKNEASGCIDSADCSKQSTYSAGSIDCTKTEEVGRFTSNDDVEEKYGDDILHFEYTTPPANIFVTKITYTVDLGTRNSANCRCPQ